MATIHGTYSQLISELETPFLKPQQNLNGETQPSEMNNVDSLKRNTSSGLIRSVPTQSESFPKTKQVGVHNAEAESEPNNSQRQYFVRFMRDLISTVNDSSSQ
jgi:hypothetical protein